MAGLYIHIPYCKTRCTYCDFNTTVCKEDKAQYIDALCKEIRERKNYIRGEEIKTIYFGGGTPSQLTIDEFKQIFETIGSTFGRINANEITLEANPDDLTREYTTALINKLPFNRISIGIQTFNDRMLKTINRRHTAIEAIQAVKLCREVGFKNISIDLMYGLPGETIDDWIEDLNQAIQLNVEHISAYHLIYEKDTLLYKQRERQEIREVDEENSILFFETLIDRLGKSGYEHYEISNFCKPAMHSKHNTSYWQGINYLGCGPSAHSFNGNEREWNIYSISDYIKGIGSGDRKYELETLDINTKYNEYIITSLRTKWGIDLQYIKEKFGNNYHEYCNQAIQKHLKYNKLEVYGDIVKLSRDGIFISDDIMSDLIIIE